MLDEAVDYMAAERPASALRWLEETMERVRSLERFPDLGRIVPELQRPEIREVLVDPYRVSYHRDERQVTILAVLHDRRLFEPGSVDEWGKCFQPAHARVRLTRSRSFAAEAPDGSPAGATIGTRISMRFGGPSCAASL
jgi:plasmid stabilization system protein ParE